MDQEEKKPTKLDVAKEIQENNLKEADAIVEYTELLSSIEDSDMGLGEKLYVKGVIEEIISDEQNHQLRLSAIYTFLTGIQPAKN